MTYTVRMMRWDASMDNWHLAGEFALPEVPAIGDRMNGLEVRCRDFQVAGSNKYVGVNIFVGKDGKLPQAS